MESNAGWPVSTEPLIVLLEDDHGVRRSMQMLLQGRGFTVKAYASAATLLADAPPANIDCLIADYRLGTLDGISVLASLRARGWAGPAILISAFGSDELIARALRAGFGAVLEKPFKDHILVAALQKLIQQHPLTRGA
jgi:FixJ family two-component response regulator